MNLKHITNILPVLFNIEVKPEHGRVRKYGGFQRVLCPPIKEGGHPAHRIFHLIDFQGDREPSWVAHSDFKKNPEFQVYFPTYEQQRTLDNLNS